MKVEHPHFRITIHFGFNQVRIQDDGGWCHAISLYLMSKIVGKSGRISDIGPDSVPEFIRGTLKKLEDSWVKTIPDEPWEIDVSGLQGKTTGSHESTRKKIGGYQTDYEQSPHSPDPPGQYEYDFKDRGIAYLCLYAYSSSKVKTEMRVAGTREPRQFQWRYTPYLADSNHAGFVVWDRTLETAFLFEPNAGGALFKFDKTHDFVDTMDDVIEWLHDRYDIHKGKRRPSRVTRAVRVELAHLKDARPSKLWRDFALS